MGRATQTQARAQIEAILSQPETYGLGTGETVTRIDTHISTLFLAGSKAYKLKKAVDFGYLDFTTLPKRRAACEHEVALNRRTAPDMYLRCVPVCEEAGALSLDGDPDNAIDWLVVMRRFDQTNLFAHLAEEGDLTETMITELADQIAEFHRRAEVRPNDGGASRFQRVLDSNLENFAPYKTSVYDGLSVPDLDRKMRAELSSVASLMDARKQAGWVRHCHGDLHLGNVALIDGKPTPFDCIEFNDDFARVDVLYDLAFLLMDLTFRASSLPAWKGYAAHALNAYVTALPVDQLKDTLKGLRLLPLFMACRAAVRSHVAARATEGASEEAKAELIRQARAYFNFAASAMGQEAPHLWAIGGLSGTGKTRLGHRLAAHVGSRIGAVHLRTDVIRKRLAGVPLNERLPKGSYTREASDAVYRALYDLAGEALDAGHSVICDGVFAAEEERQAVEALAVQRGIAFQGIWLTAETGDLEGRVTRRAEKGTDASDATAAIVRAQTAYELGHMTWAEVDASGSQDETLARALAVASLTGT